jgi:hypothetical protein
MVKMSQPIENAHQKNPHYGTFFVPKKKIAATKQMQHPFRSGPTPTAVFVKLDISFRVKIIFF